jgi:Uma2 family endonuclease
LPLTGSTVAGSAERGILIGMTQPVAVRMTYAEYLAAEAATDTRHEFLRGEVLAMAGGTPEHAALAAAVIQALGVALRGKPYRIFSSDLRGRVSATNLSTYPDVTVVCGQLERADDDEDAVVNPVIIVEVLSEATEGYDRGEKFAHYRRLPSLREYLLVSQKEPRLELYRKNEDGHWVLFEAATGQTLELMSLPEVSLVTDRIYENPLNRDA